MSSERLKEVKDGDAKIKWNWDQTKSIRHFCKHAMNFDQMVNPEI